MFSFQKGSKVDKFTQWFQSQWKGEQTCNYCTSKSSIFVQPLQTNYNIKIKVRHKGFYLRTPIAFDSKNSSLPKFWGPGIFGSLVILLFFRCHQKDLKLWSVVSGPFCHVLSAYNAWFLDELPIREYLMKYQSPISSNFPLQSVEVQSVFGATHEILLDSRNPMSGCLKLSHRDKG